MKIFALSLINFYQRRLSPHKGYCCAYRQYTGRASCSTLAYRAIQRFGVLRGVGILRLRFSKCAVAHHRYSTKTRVVHKQAGFWDLSLDLPCDLDCGSVGGDIFSNICFSFDFGGCGTSRKKQEKDRWVHIPPNIKM